MSRPRIFSFVNIFWLTLVVGHAYALDSTRAISQYAHTTWKVQDGMLPAAPFAITQSADGYFWIGTSTGLVRFDGVRFTPWKQPVESEVSSTNVTALLAASDGTVWVGTDAGLNRLQRGKLLRVSSTPGVVSAIVEAADRTIWVSRGVDARPNERLCKLVDERLDCSAVREQDLAWISCCTVVLNTDQDGGVWLGSDAALGRWHPAQTNVYRPDALSANAGMSGVLGFVTTKAGDRWVGMTPTGREGGLQKFVDGAFEPLVTPSFDSSALAVQCLFVDSNDSLWIGTFDAGLFRIHGERVDRFDMNDGLTSDAVLAIHEDREGNLWIATSKGLDQFRDLKVATFSTREGLGSDEVGSILATRDGSLWIGTASGLSVLRGGAVTTIRTRDGLPGNQVTSMHEDHAGRLWVGVDQSMTIYERGTFKPIHGIDRQSIGMVVGMAEDHEHNMWLQVSGQTRKLLRIADLQVREEFPVPRLPAARKVAADRDGLWLGLLSGEIARYRNERLETFPIDNGSTPPGSFLNRVNQLDMTEEGSMLAASGYGLIEVRNDRQRLLTTRNGLPCNRVFSFVFDAAGNLWLYLECGLVELSQRELRAWREDSQRRVTFRFFDALDGVYPGSAPFTSSAVRSQDGRLWFANPNGLQMIDPARMSENTVPPPVHIEQVIADRRTFAPQDNLNLPPLTRDLQIDYTALSFVIPQKVRFRYRLEGHDPEWQEPGTRRQAFYGDLPPGSYRFRVVASNNDGVWNEAGSTLEFSVAPAWYQTNAFRVLCALVALATIWFVYWIRMRQLAAAFNARLEERLRERTRMARELHDTLLQTIQASKLVADAALDQPSDSVGMHRTLQRVSRWLEQAVHEGRAALDSLRATTSAENDLGGSLERAASDIVPPSMTASFSVLGEVQAIHPLARDEVYRIANEAIRNACAHSGGTQLQVVVSYDRGLTVRVSDDGVGMDTSVDAQRLAGHFGVRGMHERAAQIGAKLSIVGSPTSGTEVTLHVPADIAFRR